MNTVKHAINGIVYDFEVNQENADFARQFLSSMGKNHSALSDSEVILLAVTTKTRRATAGEKSPLIYIIPVGGWR